MERYYLFEHVHMGTVSQKSQGKATGKNEKVPWMSSTPHPKDFINTFYYIVHTNVQIQKFDNVKVKVQGYFLFVTYSIIQDIISSEM